MTDLAGEEQPPRGDVQAFDARTGKKAWTFCTLPCPGDVIDSETGEDTLSDEWGNGSWRNAGHANVWTFMSADEDLGLVYLPVGSAHNDEYGGQRPGSNLFSQSLVAVDAKTSERAWHFQMVHHGLWDYDPPAAPVLFDQARSEGGRKRARETRPV